jgi:CDP-glucose 4,6-dehydratase
MNSSINHQPSTSTFFSGKKVLITGHTGFKGSWLSLWLQQLGAQVTGISLPPTTTPSLFSLLGFNSSTPPLFNCFQDIRDAANLAARVKEAEPEIVFHLAAQPLVRASYREPLTTFATNVMGTANLLDALRGVTSVRTVVAVTTDKVYRNIEHPYPYREEDHLGGHDPYSASKAASELIVSSYRDAFLAEQGVAIATARAGNVIGGGDWSEDRLIPDAVRAWQGSQPLEIRRPDAIRPWQHVLEPLAGYMVLAEKLWETPELAGAYNFGPETSEAATVREVVELAQPAYGRGEVLWGDGSEGPHEAGWLALEIAKARTVLGVTPRWGLAESVNRTMDWYRRLAAGEDAKALCLEDIEAYEAAW